jgi:sirohydrochlorin ferrochelatase
VSAPRHLSYYFDGFDEACLSFGDADAARRIMIVPPLFGEMNHVRAVLVGAMRMLAQRGVATFLPDFPGCNESLAPMAVQTVKAWRAAMAAAAVQSAATHVASVRGGALLVADIALPQWQLMPAKGASLVKTMLRARIVSDREAGRLSNIDSLMAEAQRGPVELSGYLLGADLLSGLDGAVPGQGAYEMMLGDEPGKLAGKPLWLRAEPQEDPQMSAALAAELDRWSASCGR